MKSHRGGIPQAALELLAGEEEGGSDLVDGLLHGADGVGDQRLPRPGEVALLLAQHLRLLPLQRPLLALHSLQCLRTQPGHSVARKAGSAS